jgi:alkylation response protein AidB-like acyl-CoA dehydrogenase
VSVHSLACFPVAHQGSPELRTQLLPELLGGELLGAYCLSEPQSGSDAAGLRTSAVRAGTENDPYTITGTKAWTTHAGAADFYTVFARTGEDRTRGISCFHVPAGAAGLTVAAAERKMGMRSSPTAQVHFDGVEVPGGNRIGAEGAGFPAAMAALDGGRLGIAACAVGVAQSALDAAVSFVSERRQFGRVIGEFQGLRFMLADMATGVAAARALYLTAARRKDAGRPYGQEAAMAKLFATDTAMRVATDAVQLLGGYGYVEDYPAERYLREAKVLQIVEGTNQIQRIVIGRGLVGT